MRATNWPAIARCKPAQFLCPPAATRTSPPSRRHHPLHMRPKRPLLAPAVGAAPSRRDGGERRARADRLLRQALRLLVDEIAAAADEAAARRAERRDLRARVGTPAHLRRSEELVADRDAAAFARDQVDAEI